MTPERRQFVARLISKVGSSLCCDQIDSVALSELGVAMCDIAEDNDAQAAELANIREMLREWREKRREEAIWQCIRDYQYRAMTDWSLRMTGDQLEDSCRCLYGKEK